MRSAGPTPTARRTPRSGRSTYYLVLVLAVDAKDRYARAPLRDLRPLRDVPRRSGSGCRPSCARPSGSPVCSTTSARSASPPDPAQARQARARPSSRSCSSTWCWVTRSSRSAGPRHDPRGDPPSPRAMGRRRLCRPARRRRDPAARAVDRRRRHVLRDDHHRPYRRRSRWTKSASSRGSRTRPAASSRRRLVTAFISRADPHPPLPVTAPIQAFEAGRWCRRGSREDGRRPRDGQALRADRGRAGGRGVRTFCALIPDPHATRTRWCRPVR